MTKFSLVTLTPEALEGLRKQLQYGETTKVAHKVDMEDTNISKMLRGDYPLKGKCKIAVEVINAIESTVKTRLLLQEKLNQKYSK